MAAPSYVQSMLDTPFRGHHGLMNGHSADSEGELSSIPDISTVATHSDTDDGDHVTNGPQDGRKRSLMSSIKSRLHSRSGNAAAAATTHTAEDQIAAQSNSRPASSWRDDYQASASASENDLVGSGQSRAGSIYTLSRLSFSSRLAQLTSIPLPTASSLQARISTQPTAHLAAKSLAEAGDQIKMWTKRAADVLHELDAQDDVEWSAAGGRDGLLEMDQAITRFEGLVKVYVISMEELQMRSDVRTLSDQTLKEHVMQMDDVVLEWSKIRRQLKDIKEQVELSLDWEELWNSALGEIGQEMGALSDLVFAMEEKRHEIFQPPKSTSNAAATDGSGAANKNGAASQSSYHTPTSKILDYQASPHMPADIAAMQAKDDEQLLALFARMQPLRASLDFVPMRLSTFTTRAVNVFPSGCEELEARRDQLEQQWRKLDADATALKKELGDDKWLMVFRNAGHQAQSMFDSVERSRAKLSQALTSSTAQADTHNFAQMVESYEAKKTHYLPAVERVLSLIDKGVKDRLSVNGEILRMQSDMNKRYSVLLTALRDLDTRLSRRPGDAQGQQLRDSISTILTSEKSMASSALDTPQSSPASSVLLRSRNGSFTGARTPTAPTSSKLPKTRRPSGLGTVTPSAKASRTSDAYRSTTSPLPSGSVPYKGKRDEPFRTFKDPTNKPKWNAGGKATTASEKRDFLPLASTAPSPYRKVDPTPRKYTPSRYRQRMVSNSQIPESPSSGTSQTTTPVARSTSLAATLPPRAASALEHRAFSLGAHSTTTPSRPRLQPPNTPLTSRKSSATPSRLPALRDSGIDEEGGGELGNAQPAVPPSRPWLSHRTPSRLSSRPQSALSTATNATRTSSSAATATLANTTNTTTTSTSSQRRGSVASSSGSGIARRTSGALATPQGVWSRGGGRDSRLGSRAASALGFRGKSAGAGRESLGGLGPGIGADAEADRPKWRG